MSPAKNMNTIIKIIPAITLAILVTQLCPSCLTAVETGYKTGKSYRQFKKTVVGMQRDTTITGNTPGLAALPQASIYRTSQDVDAYVPVQVNPASGELISYPAPGDITGASMPVVLKDGWLLDRRGVSPGTRFVRYTYSQYAALPQAPTPAQLMEAIIPGARVVEIATLPAPVGTVTPAQADSLISAGLPGCTVTYSAPVLDTDR